jgi:sarcosine oxidase/L-pipecolate oxidase
MAKIPWNNLTTPDNIDQKLENWNTFFRNNLDKYFPVRRKRIRQKSHPWLDSSILRLMRRRDYVHKPALRLSDSDTWELYKQLRNQVTSKLRKQRRDFFKHRLNEQRGNPKEFWKTLRLVLPKKNKSTCINDLVVENNEIIDPKQITNALNSHFVGIGNSVLSEAFPDQVKISTPTENLNERDHRANLFTFQSITNEQVYNALIAINTEKKKGADDISAKAIRLVAGQIAPSVAYLFNESFRLGTFLSAWKLARVSPLHKGGDSSNRDNQRPISILPCLSKVYEGLANLQLLQGYACESKTISDKQFAYKRFSSCNVALILLVDEWKWAIDSKHLTVAAFLDLRKAFNVINHRLLLSKLKNGGISGIAQARKLS